MPSLEAIARKSKHAEQSELNVDSGRKIRARLRSLNYKEPPREVSSGDYAGLDFETRMAAIGLQEVAPAFGRPAWKSPHKVDDLAEELAWLDAKDLAEEQAAEKADFDAKVEARAHKLLAERLALQPVQMPAPIPAPAPAPPPRRVPQDLTLGISARDPFGRIARLTGSVDGEPVVQIRTSSRDGSGRLTSVSVEPQDGMPYRLKVRRDGAGKLLGLQIEGA